MAHPLPRGANRTDQGWPEEHGPRPVLAKLGLIRSVDEYLPWARHTAHRINSVGIPSYTSSATFLNKQAIQCLAALSLKGFAVRIDGTYSREVRIHISSPDTNH